MRPSPKRRTTTQEIDLMEIPLSKAGGSIAMALYEKIKALQEITTKPADLDIGEFFKDSPELSKAIKNANGLVLLLNIVNASLNLGSKEGLAMSQRPDSEEMCTVSIQTGRGGDTRQVASLVKLLLRIEESEQRVQLNWLSRSHEDEKEAGRHHGGSILISKDHHVEVDSGSIIDDFVLGNIKDEMAIDVIKGNNFSFDTVVGLQEPNSYEFLAQLLECLNKASHKDLNTLSVTHQVALKDVSSLLRVANIQGLAQSLPFIECIGMERRINRPDPELTFTPRYKGPTPSSDARISALEMKSGKSGALSLAIKAVQFLNFLDATPLDGKAKVRMILTTLIKERSGEPNWAVTKISGNEVYHFDKLSIKSYLAEKLNLKEEAVLSQNTKLKVGL